MSGADLVLSQQAANQQIDGLYSAHHGWLYNWLHRKLGDAADAADLAHDTFIRLMVSRRAPAGEPRAFLAHVAKGLMIDHWRRRDVERAYLEAIASLPVPEAPSEETRLQIVEALCQIEAMLRDMPARTRDIFLLAQLDGFTYQQIAQQFDMPLITVKRHMQRAFVACLSVM